MGDIAFEIRSNVDINKNVDFDINKDVNANVNNQDQLATAQSDAEAFGENALAETDTYTYVNGEPGEPGEPVLNPGSIDALGNTDDLIFGGDADGGGAPDTLTVSFNADGDPPPDVDDINGFGSLDGLSSPPPETADVSLPDPLLSITNLNLTEVEDTLITTPGGDAEAQYTNNEDWVVNFGSRTLDLDGDGTATEGELVLTVPTGSTYLAEVLANGEIELEFEAFPEGTSGIFTFDGEIYNTTAFVSNAESLQIGATGDWAFEAASDFGGAIPPIPGDGESFSYSESVAALDLNSDGDIL